MVLARDHPASFARFMHDTLFDHVDVDPGRAHLLDGAASDPATEAGSPLGSRTRCVTLTPSTRDGNQRFFGGEVVPAQALTMDIATILQAPEIILAAAGARKARAVACAVGGPVTPECPAFALQTHPATTIVCDRHAANSLQSRSDGAPCATS